jgi:polysaccharide chain length determinant protein (PEP-CTERM system associated)
MKEIVEIQKYLDTIAKRKYWIILLLLLSFLGGLTYAMTARRMFRGEDLILVVPQKVPEGYVQSIIHVGMEERLRTIKQQVTSRTNLERIIAEHVLFNEPEREKLLSEEKVELFRKRIGINVTRGTAFSITFDYEDPKKAMDVTNKLASNFIAENLIMREDQALGTSQFLTDELDSIKKRLEEKEELTKKYRQEHMGAMPQDITSNLSALQRLQSQLDQLGISLRAAEERRLVVQQQITTQRMLEQQMSGPGLSDSSSEPETSGQPGHNASPELVSLRSQLSQLERKYTTNHPEVRRVKNMIAKIESEQAELPSEKPETEATTKKTDQMGGFAMADLLKPQLEQVNSEITSLRNEIQKVKSQVQVYERRVEDTPKREQEMISLTRDYENLKSLYDSFLKRKLEADIAINMEKKQKGEQFRLLDAAKLPERPIRPNVLMILLFSLAFGLCLGGVTALVVESLDSSYRNPDEIEKELKLPVLVSIPFRHTEQEIKARKRNEVLKAAGVAAGFAVSVVAILVGTKGFSKTVEYIKGLTGL